MLNCLQEVRTWLTQNFLNLNENKTEIVVFDPKSPNNIFGPLAPHICCSARILRVVLDSKFKMDKQINSVIKTSFFQLQTLRKVKASLPDRDFQRVIHMFISSHLDYCNSLYYWMDQFLLDRLRVQNAAARMLT